MVSAPPILIHAANPSPLTGRGNNTWLLDGVGPALIDAGVGVQTDVDAIAGAPGRRAAQIFRASTPSLRTSPRQTASRSSSFDTTRSARSARYASTS